MHTKVHVRVFFQDLLRVHILTLDFGPHIPVITRWSDPPGAQCIENLTFNPRIVRICDEGRYILA